MGAIGFVSNGLAAESSSVLDKLKRRGGLCVQLGGGDGRLTADLARAGTFLVHRLERRQESVEQVRAYLQSQRVYGRASVERWTAKRLPYVDNLVSTVIVDDLMGLPRQEVMRVLSPNGILFLRTDTGYDSIRKRRPEKMDEWTHQWHGANGNMLSNDTALGVPNGVQWLAGPLFPTAARKSSTRGMLSAGGRAFYITQNHLENLVWDKAERPNHLIARDAFNGLPLWQIPWTPPVTANGSAFECLVATRDKLFGVNGDELIAVDAATGDTLYQFASAEPPRKILYDSGLLVTEAKNWLAAFDAQTGDERWRTSAHSPYGTIADENRIFCVVGSRQQSGKWLHEILCLDLTNGREIWRRPTVSEHSLGRSPPAGDSVRRGGTTLPGRQRTLACAFGRRWKRSVA